MTDAAPQPLSGKGCAIAAPAGLAAALGQRLERQGATVALCSATPDEAAAEAAFEGVLEKLPRLDTLLVVPPQPPARGLLETDLACWQEALATTLRATFLLCRGTIGEWLASGGGGRIVLVAPAAERGDSTAAVVQAALLSLVRSLTKEYGGRGVSCNAVVQGPGTRAEDVDPALVEVILFLASEQASYVSGETLLVSGLDR